MNKKESKDASLTHSQSSMRKTKFAIKLTLEALVALIAISMLYLVAIVFVL